MTGCTQDALDELAMSQQQEMGLLAARLQEELEAEREAKVMLWSPHGVNAM